MDVREGRHGAGWLEDAQGKFLEIQLPAELWVSIFALGISSEKITGALLSDKKGPRSLKKTDALLW